MGIPAYSEDALLNQDILFDRVVSVHFFVEDEDLASFYESLVDRLFPRLGKFEVFCLGGKTNVLRHAALVRSNPHGAKKLYLLDKDFDDVLGRMVARDNVFYLDDFSIETSVIDDVALTQICVEERPRRRRGEISRMINYGPTLANWLPDLDRLHRAFALAQKYDLGFPSTDLAPERFCLADKSQLSPQHVSDYIQQVADALIAKGVISNQTEYPEVARRIFGSARLFKKHVNGKVLSRLHYHRLKKLRLLSNISQESILMRSVSWSKLTRLRSVRARIGRYLKDQGLL